MLCARGSLIKNFGKLAHGKGSVRFASTARQVAPQQSSGASNLTTQDNGLRVASYNNSKKTTTVGVWIDSGSRYETGTTNGVASLYEQLIYTGTPSRPASKLQSDLAKVGAQLKSVTTRDHTAYFAECMAGDVEQVVEILAEVLGNTEFTDAQLEEQRHILLRKIEEHEETYRSWTYDNLHRTAFQGNSMSFAPIGVDKNVKNLTKEDVLEFADDHYKPHRMVLTGVGGVEHEQLERLAEKHFGHLKNEYKRKMPNPESLRHTARFTGSDFQFRNDLIPLMYVAIAVEGVPRGHPDALPLLVASQYCGNYDRKQSDTTIVPHTLQEKLSKMDECQAFESFSMNYANCGLFGMYYVCKGLHIWDVLCICKETQKFWKHLAFSAVDAEIDWAKYGLKTRLFKELENNTNLASHVATEVLSNGKITPLPDLEQQIDAINAKTVQKVMMQHVYDRDPALAGVGKTEAFPPWYDVKGGMSWWRM
ncbi:insulinase (Peptidase family m16) domain-containing protein [Ditylenchus destructor]|uniref:Insulinase (Peptidase family m16) domain-containing protein n=1 Tax=Ditylenchus destructor TaxID=166010 RepID=A0AAD4R5E4_9BILA|nr:insulinase (Peptidase family m16) domain-containing protein [Ditylenchus destructor]